MVSTKGYVPIIIKILNTVIIKIACAGRFLTSFNLLAPKYCDTIDEMALLLCPKTQISIERKVETIPTAAKDSVAFKFTLPIIAASVRDSIGSETPEINAGIAKVLICFRLILVLKTLLEFLDSTKFGRFSIKNCIFVV